ncbi:Lactoylglutathione lyase / glyoxalase I family protein [Quillaja saponaria]|uniref:Lactoylglutathione lyase / glyoxalase I family protein n=1 Tax=Quillaja saponaria TaxID=32244 RepID=A0AAD7PI95_QUISA|nr:Lactoylglutathione lyase / glyoxalase I family protein [Quillaja saponaria]
MASLLTPPAIVPLQHKVSHVGFHSVTTNLGFKHHSIRRNGRYGEPNSRIKAKVAIEGNVLDKESDSVNDESNYGIVSVHHVGILCENLERSLDFYQNILGLKINEARPNDKLPYRGAWLWVGSQMIHLMELPNPDPLTGRPEHGGRDRHTCIAIRDVSKLKTIFDEAGIPYTLSLSGRPAIFTRDPDTNALEFTQVDD